MTERIKKLVDRTVRGEMWVEPVKIEYDRTDLFLSPVKMSAKRVCEYMKTEEISYIDSPVCDKAFNPAIAANGNIYGFCSGNGILKIDTKTDKVKILYEDCKIGSYGTKGGINGKLYSLPGYTNDVWAFDPFSETLEKCYSIDGQNQVNYAGGAIDLNGDIYALPVHADNIFKISFKKYNITIPLDIYNTFFKDCY